MFSRIFTVERCFARPTMNVVSEGAPEARRVLDLVLGDVDDLGDRVDDQPHQHRRSRAERVGVDDDDARQLGVLDPPHAELARAGRAPG